MSEVIGRGVLDFSMKALTVAISIPRLSRMGSKASLLKEKYIKISNDNHVAALSEANKNDRDVTTHT